MSSIFTCSARDLSSLLVLLFTSAWLRLVNLGYSDYIGDEIKALAILAPGQSFIEFILQQRRGPIQYLVTHITSWFINGYSDRFLTRLPFALAGILAIVLFYQFVKWQFDRKIAIFAALFFCTNGLFIGLTRIAQYQPFVMLFSIMTLLFLHLAGSHERWREAGLYMAAFSWIMAIASHYDGIFIAPYVGYLTWKWYQAGAQIPQRKRVRHLLLAGGGMAVILGGFILNLLLSESKSTEIYWMERFTGEGVTDGMPSSIAHFTLYNPTLVIYLYVILVFLALVQFKKTWVVLLWLLFPWFVLEAVIFDPGTHIYTYLLPTTILAGVGLQTIRQLLEHLAKVKLARWFAYLLPVVLFSYLFGLAHLIFIDHTPEYPWTNRRILTWTIGMPDERYRMWIYGFPYQRGWDEIKELVEANPQAAYYVTNEDKPIAAFHIRMPFDTEKAGYYIHIHRPYSSRDRLASDKIRYWMKKYPPVNVIRRNGGVVSEIYLMPAGTIEEIRQAGY